jgi:hypothetical protein
MKFIIALTVLTSFNLFAQDYERCNYTQIKNTQKNSTAMCNEHLREFSSRSNATCKSLKYDLNVCWAECVDETRAKLARVRVDMSSDCERELVYYHRTVIKYYR